MRVLITGAAGFIGSHLTDELLSRGWNVLATDILDQPDAKNLAHIDNERYEYRVLDVNDVNKTADAMKGCDVIFHLAANSDIRAGSSDPKLDMDSTLLTTISVLEAMRSSGVKNMLFASSSTVYGDTNGKKVKEDSQCFPISYYGAAKLASETLISTYSYMNSFNSLILRLPNVVGPRLTHGAIYDLLNKLRNDPKELEILGDGKQRKQYVHVSDVVKVIADMSSDVSGTEIYNISPDSSTTVKEIADMICARLGLKGVKYRYTEGKCGWKGDIHSFSLDSSKAAAKGWKPSYGSNEAVQKALELI